MKIFPYLAFLASTAIVGSLHAATTDVMGGMVVNIPAGNVLFAPTFVHNDTFVGDISAIAEDLGEETTTLTFSGVDFTSDEYAEGANFPAYYVEVLEAGANQGLILDVLSNGATSVTVHGLLSSDFGITTDTQIALRKHLTIGEVFESATLLAYADSVTFYNSDGSSTVYLWTGSGWSPDFGVSLHSDRQIYPGTGVLVALDSATEVVLSGKVRNSPSKIPLYAGAINLVSSGSPVDSVIGGIGLESILSPYAESVTTYVDNGSMALNSVYLYTGSYLSGDFGVSDSSEDSLVSGEAIVVEVQSDKYVTIPSAY